MIHNSEKGITIYIALLVMSGALAIALSVSTIFIGEFKIARETADSLKAVYVADSAMEYTLYQSRPEATYVYNISTNTSTLSFVLLSSTINSYNSPITMPLNCGALISNASCFASTELVAKGSTPSCPSSITAADCTRIVAKGSFGGVNRAMEIVYPNL